MKRVLICGYIGAANFGDEAVLSKVIESLECEITVISRDPEYTTRLHGVGALYHLDDIGIMRQMRRSDHLILGGGTLLQRNTSIRSLIRYTQIAQTAALLGLPFTLFGGIDDTSPLSGSVIKRADALILRDRRSLCIARRFGAGERTIYAPDPVLASNPGSNAAPGRSIIISCPRRDDQRSAIAAARLSERTGMRHILLACAPDDIGFCRSAAGVCGTGYFFSPDPQKTGNFIRSCGMVLSSRLHPCIAAYAAGIPFAAFSNDNKIKAFASECGNPGVLISDPFDSRLFDIPRDFDFSRREGMQKRALNGLKALSDIVLGIRTASGSRGR